MNKLVKAGLAGAAALAIAAGGGTYALWSDYVVDGGNQVGADSLKITIAGAPSGSQAFQFDKLDLAPGEDIDQENVITGRVGGADINEAEAFVTFQGLSDADNGCGGSNAEAATGDNCANETTSNGELSQQARVTTINVRETDGNCAGPNLGPAVGVLPSGTHTLASIQNQKISLGELGDGDKFCVKMVIGLPGSATNVVMTDTSAFQLRYDLEQIPNTP